MQVCVFCSSRNEVAEPYFEAARELGNLIGAGGHGLVYGGASVGLMGAVADAALAGGAEVVGIIPSWLGASNEISHASLSKLIQVETMSERKERMFSLSDVIVTLPGGVGTFDELFEVMTLVSLGRLRMPHGLVNTKGYFDPLIAMLEKAVAEKMISTSVLESLVVAENPAAILKHLGD